MENYFSAEISRRDIKTLARLISLVENEISGYEDFMLKLAPNSACKVIGITGPPGAGKSTITDALIENLVNEGKTVAVICVDPSSPFNLGALLGDRIRMSNWYNNPLVYIRSLATRGSLGGLHPKIIEITDLLKAASFDYVIIETVGVGQTEIEISGLADLTVVVLVPESGDDIQSMKAGIMEIADIFVVNKSDRPEADSFKHTLQRMIDPAFRKEKKHIPVISTIASEKTGVAELREEIELVNLEKKKEMRVWLLVEKAFQLITAKKMKSVSKKEMYTEILNSGHDFQLYQFIQRYL